MQYNITIPCTMSISVTVTADNKEEAISKAFNLSWYLKVIAEDKEAENAAPEINELELHRMICQGNVFHGCINELEIEEA